MKTPFWQLSTKSRNCWCYIIPVMATCSSLITCEERDDLIEYKDVYKLRPLSLYPHITTGQYFPHYHALTRSVIALHIHSPLLSDTRRCTPWKIIANRLMLKPARGLNMWAFLFYNKRNRFFSIGMAKTWLVSVRLGTCIKNIKNCHITNARLIRWYQPFSFGHISVFANGYYSYR